MAVCPPMLWQDSLQHYGYVPNASELDIAYQYFLFRHAFPDACHIFRSVSERYSDFILLSSLDLVLESWVDYTRHTKIITMTSHYCWMMFIMKQ